MYNVIGIITDTMAVSPNGVEDHIVTVTEGEMFSVSEMVYVALLARRMVRLATDAEVAEHFKKLELPINTKVITPEATKPETVANKVITPEGKIPVMEKKAV